MRIRHGGAQRTLLGIVAVGGIILAGCGLATQSSAPTAPTGSAAAVAAPAGMPTSDSLQGWHQSSTGTQALSRTVGDPRPPSLELPGDGSSYVWADLGKPIDQFSFDVKTQGLFDFFFGANQSGQGYLFRIDTRGGTNYSGFATTTSWTTWDCPLTGSTTDPAGTWLHVVLTIGGANVATATVTGSGVHETDLFAGQAVGCNTSNQPEVLWKYQPQGTAFGFQGDGLGATSETWIANFR